MRERHRDALRRLAQVDPVAAANVQAPAPVLQEAVWRAATVPVARPSRARLIVTAVAVAAVAMAALVLAGRVAGGVPRSRAVTQYAFTVSGSPHSAPTRRAHRVRPVGPARRAAAAAPAARPRSAPPSSAPPAPAPIAPAPAAAWARPTTPAKPSSVVATMSPGGKAVASAPSRGGVSGSAGAGAQNRSTAPTVTVTQPRPRHRRPKRHHRGH
jgi:hypothetical protein